MDSHHHYDLGQKPFNIVNQTAHHPLVEGVMMEARSTPVKFYINETVTIYVSTPL